MVSLADVRMITVQLSFSNPSVIPARVRRLEPETELGHLARGLQTPGELVIKPTENCSVYFLAELGVLGFELVDALYQKRIGNYHMVRYLFVLPELALPTEEFLTARRSIKAELREMLSVAFWRVRAYRNPYYKNGKEVGGQATVSINLEARRPRFLPDGHPVTARLKDESRKRAGTPQPLKPDFLLTVMAGLELVASDQG